MAVLSFSAIVARGRLAKVAIMIAAMLWTRPADAAGASSGYVSLGEAPQVVQQGVIRITASCYETAQATRAHARLLEAPIGGPRSRDYVFNEGKAAWTGPRPLIGGLCSANNAWDAVWLADERGRYHRYWLTYSNLFVRAGGFVIMAVDMHCHDPALRDTHAWEDCQRVSRWDPETARLVPLSPDLSAAEARAWLDRRGYRPFAW